MTCFFHSIRSVIGIEMSRHIKNTNVIIFSSSSLPLLPSFSDFYFSHRTRERLGLKRPNAPNDNATFFRCYIILFMNILIKIMIDDDRWWSMMIVGFRSKYQYKMLTQLLVILFIEISIITIIVDVQMTSKCGENKKGSCHKTKYEFRHTSKWSLFVVYNIYCEWHDLVMSSVCLYSNNTYM